MNLSYPCVVRGNSSNRDWSEHPDIGLLYLHCDGTIYRCCAIVSIPPFQRTQRIIYI